MSENALLCIYIGGMFLTMFMFFLYADIGEEDDIDLFIGLFYGLLWPVFVPLSLAYIFARLVGLLWRPAKKGGGR